ncbi:hypothetical protein OSB04_009853 [Centaurea solstitialis]|uniref:Reverse transcriptase Ty1/copia-type domain-containing protein n=1 Tax=Centaurea solstitialis TaxID=347529 RepID=A0AA38T6E4_9ASTR|nr:hypothetical protein OSB04_009853 [Centaurea solstitialis]
MTGSEIPQLSSSKITETKLHPTTTVSNIKNFIPIILEIESSQYNSWATLFKIHCKAFLVIDHLSPRPQAASPSSPTSTDPNKPSDEWERLDAIVLQWMYSTISNDLLHTIINNTATAHDAWVAIENLFHDNKSARAIHLLHKFSNTRLDGFSNMSAYCQELKTLADQLANVNAPVDNDRLVLQLIAGLNEQYEGIATLLQGQEPLPTFYNARSKLIQVKSRKAEQALQASKSTGSALTATTNRSTSTDSYRPDDRSISRGRGRSGRRGRGRGNNFGRGRSMYQPWQQQFYGPWSQPWMNQQYYSPFNQAQQQQFSAQWPVPPCPYPSTSRPNNNHQAQSAGILGSRPHQAHTAYSPTDIEHALYTMSLQQPDPTLYMDMGTSSTMSHDSGDYHSFSNSCLSQKIVVGNGQSIPVLGQGTKYLPKPFPPFILKNVLYSPKLVKNLISVRRFTTDNSVSVEFDPFGFLVKDYKTKRPLLRCNSSGDLYPLVLGSSLSQPTALTAIYAQLWHHRLGHPGRSNGTWELVPRSSDMNVIRSMWLYKHKYMSDGSLERYKARLVCDGRSQQVGIDCGETFSPVVKPATIRTVLSITLSNQWSVHQLDVTNAFLHGNLNETVYMHQPMGFRNKKFPDHVCLLKKSLYGLKQAPRAWYQRFTDYVLLLGFRHSRCDASLFTFHQGNDTAFLLLYVDDILLVTSSGILRQRLMTSLAQEFAMKDLGPLSYFLGISVSRTSRGMFLSQQSYANDIIARAGMQSCNPVTTPVDTSTKLSATTSDLFHDPTLYRSLAGALQYLTFTRPNITYAVQQICMHMHSPRTDHWNALKRIIRYIKGTTSLGLMLTPATSPSLISYTDPDWAGCPDTRRSTNGYCIYFGDNLISWSSKRQSTVSRSSAEAEYRGVANVVAEICWLRNLLLELRIPLSCATLVYCDNVSAIYLSGNPVQHQRTKHIELDIHFVREKVQRGQVRVLHVSSRYQIADIFTKGLPRILFEDFRSSLSIRSPPASTAGV